MRLHEAIASGSKFKRAGSGVILTANSNFTSADVTATDYEIVTETITVTTEELAEAWDDIAASFRSVKSSGESELFKKLCAYLTTNHSE